jgi:ribonuclease J
MTPRNDEVLFLPLGGCGEIGMNMTLYGHDGRWLIVDLGITFANDSFPGYDVLMPDPGFIAERTEQLAGIVLTHGHEDHIGALPYLWPRLRCPIYATPFTAALVMRKLVRAGIHGVPLIEMQPGEPFVVEPFTLQYIAMTHSIPEPNMLLIGTPAGRVLHSGDWKLDRAPVVGSHFDRERLLQLRGSGLLAFACDSTNAVVEGRTGSEGDLQQGLLKVVQDRPYRVVVTSFASNVARLVTLARVAQASGRRFAVIGRAMDNMLRLARAHGYWPADLPDPVTADHVGYLPRHEVLVACTGSQGESRAALARMAADAHPDLPLEAGDTVVFSSRMIPGNERSVIGLQDRLRGLGITVVTDADAPVHVSGHPAREDLRELYGWLAPDAVIPVHGTPRHLQANAELALASGAGAAHVPDNGEICRLTGDGPRVVDRVASGRLYVDANGGLAPLPATTVAQMRDGAC